MRENPFKQGTILGSVCFEVSRCQITGLFPSLVRIYLRVSRPIYVHLFGGI